MTAQDFNGKMQDLALLAGESEITSEFTAGLQAVLDEAQKDLEFAMTAGEFAAVKVRINPLRQILQAQTEFLKNLREKVLAEMWPDNKPSAPESLN